MLANGTGQTTDTWTYDAWGETTSRTGVTENDYLYAGERFDRTTELYQLRARYMDPKTGTFLSLDPYQGNRHDPASLHKYMYANANPVNNVDPTGLTSIAEMSGAMAGQGILAGSSGLNFWTVLGALKGAAYGVQFACSMRSLIVAAVTGDAGEFLLALSNGIVSFVGLIGICETHFAVQILTKALAAYGVKENGEEFLKALHDRDAGKMLISGFNLAMDIVTLFSSCFDGDTPVATETGFRRIDEIRAGDRVWSYNVETGERALKVVKEVFVRENDELLHIETSRGAIDATTDHPFYVVSKGWVAAGDLAVGDSIQAISGDAGIVTGLKLEKLNKPISVYNLEVEGFHSYFVADGVLVHNEKYPSGKDFNSYERDLKSNKTLVFDTKENAENFIKHIKEKFKRTNPFKDDLVGHRSAEGWHFDSHPIKGISEQTIDHINIYSKKMGFNVHIFWKK